MLKLYIFLCISVCASAVPKFFTNNLAKPCDREACKLPDCLCAATSPPNGLQPTNIPQFVLLTFDDALGIQNSHYYIDAFNGRNNPNKCPISTTYFISHEYTNYSTVNEFVSKGHEIASHSISHTANTDYWNNLSVNELNLEFVDHIKLISKFANIPESSIKGARVPFLQIPGDNYYQMIEDSTFVYDCSWPTQVYMNSGLFPYTLDYASIQDCPIGKCPLNSHPGVWVIPMVDWMDLSGTPCAMVDACQNVPTDTQQILNFMKTNFHRHYDSSRSPFGFYVHASWFSIKERFDAYKLFLDYLGEFDDVYMVSASMVIDWMKNPVSKEEYLTNAKCSSGNAGPCRVSKTCYLKKGEEERVMPVCTDVCPNVYPWVGNPLGN
ncbi:hypothetical protein FQR65_LT05352 [Abscondita terminalis]|nr:hypothetical protein FQR65_LT05352 [Abscondita terminalis]